MSLWRRKADPDGWKTRARVAGAILAVAPLGATWPLAAGVTHRIGTGGGPPTVRQLGLYTTKWTSQVVEGGRSYWDAPFFYPHLTTVAWSEPQPFTSGLVWFLSKLIGIITAYNIILLVYLAGAGLATFASARRLTGGQRAAFAMVKAGEPPALSGWSGWAESAAATRLARRRDRARQVIQRADR